MRFSISTLGLRPVFEGRESVVTPKPPAAVGLNPLKDLDLKEGQRFGIPSARLGFPSARFGFPSDWLGFPSAQLGIPSVRLGVGVNTWEAMISLGRS
jgi:hypothetical protein